MKKIMLVLMALAALPVVAVARGDEQFGAAVTLKTAVPIADLYAAPETFVGKTIRLDGVVSAVCEMMGCWMALASADNKDQVVRFKVDHGAKIVFPLSARGKRASAEGIFERIAAGDHESHEAAGEHQTSDAKAAAFGKTYQVKATGAVVYDAR
jgi:hypothetical protein